MGDILLRTSKAYYLLYYCACLPIAYVLPMRKIIFWRKMFYSSNIVLHTLAKDCKLYIYIYVILFKEVFVMGDILLRTSKAYYHAHTVV